MNQKVLQIIALIILVIALVGVAGYFVFSKKSVTIPPASTNILPSAKNNFSPTIDSISENSGHEGDIITVYGSNFMKMIMSGPLKGEISTVQFLQNGKVIKSTEAINVSSDGKQLSFSYDSQHIIGASRLPAGTYQLRISNHIGEKGLDTDYVLSNTIDFTSLTETQVTNRKSINDVKVGEIIGKFRIVSIERFPSGDFTVSFSGETSVLGKYVIIEALGNTSCIVVSEESKAEIPRFKEDMRDEFFCVSDEAAKQLTGLEGKEISVIIKDYYLNYLSKGVSDTAELVRIIK